MLAFSSRRTSIFSDFLGEPRDGFAQAPTCPRRRPWTTSLVDVVDDDGSSAEECAIAAEMALVNLAALLATQPGGGLPASRCSAESRKIAARAGRGAAEVALKARARIW